MPRNAALPRVELVHTVLGRTRLRLVDGRGDYEALEALAYALGDIDGVHAVDARPSTASLVVHHDGDFAIVAARATERRMFVLGQAAPPEAAARGPLDALDPRSMAVLGEAAVFAGLGIWQLSRGAVLPPALTLLLYAGKLTERIVRGASARSSPIPEPDPYD